MLFFNVNKDKINGTPHFETNKNIYGVLFFFFNFDRLTYILIMKKRRYLHLKIEFQLYMHMHDYNFANYLSNF
jgi:hypothetical protein